MTKTKNKTEYLIGKTVLLVGVIHKNGFATTISQQYQKNCSKTCAFHL